MNPDNNPQPANPAMPQPLNTAGALNPDMMAGVAPAQSDTPSVPPGIGLPPQMPESPQVTQSGGGKKMMIIIIIILVLAILGVGGYYFYTQLGQKSTQPIPQTAQPDQDLVNLQSESEKIEVTDPAGDLTEVDSEINLLEATPAADNR